jgi:hypothetical protein
MLEGNDSAIEDPTVTVGAIPSTGRRVRERPRPADAAARRAERPTPVTRDHPARPGVKVEPPQPPVGRLAVQGRRRRRRGGTTLTPAACRAGW